MKLEQEIQQRKFNSEMQKAHLNIMFTSGWLKNQINGFLKPYGITPEQFNVMRILRGQHPNAICIRDITSRMIDKSSNASRIVDKLETKQLAVRKTSATDRRESVVTLTEKGLALCNEHTGIIDTNTPVISNLSEDHARQLNEILDLMRENR